MTSIVQDKFVSLKNKCIDCIVLVFGSVRPSRADSLRASAKKTSNADIPFAQTKKTSSGVALPLAHLLLVIGSRVRSRGGGAGEGGEAEEEPRKEEGDVRLPASSTPKGRSQPSSSPLSRASPSPPLLPHHRISPTTVAASLEAAR
jgi:hypothetical protein